MSPINFEIYIWWYRDVNGSDIIRLYPDPNPEIIEFEYSDTDPDNFLSDTDADTVLDIEPDMDPDANNYPNPTY